MGGGLSTVTAIVCQWYIPFGFLCAVFCARHSSLAISANAALFCAHSSSVSWRSVKKTAQSPHSAVRFDASAFCYAKCFGRYWGAGRRCGTMLRLIALATAAPRHRFARLRASVSRAGGSMRRTTAPRRPILRTLR